MNERQSLHPRVLEITLGETSSILEPKIDIFKVEGQSLEDKMEEIPNQNQNCPVDQAVRRMKLREYFDSI